MRLWTRPSSPPDPPANLTTIARRFEATPGDRVLIGGVGERWMGDASFGLLAADRLASLPSSSGVQVADLGYSALFVAQDLPAATRAYCRLILVAGVARGRALGTLRRYRWHPAPATSTEIEERIREAGAGAVSLDHLLSIGHHFGVLPPEVVVFELEPVTMTGEALSAQGAAVLEGLVEVLHREAQRGLALASTSGPNGAARNGAPS
jgi:hydrogenase maturation protease